MRWSRERAGYFAIESILIMAGVLGALMVNALWQDHTDRVREGQYLDQLLSDALDNRRRLEDVLELERNQQEITRAILAALRIGAPLPADSVRAWRHGETPFPWYSDPRLRDGTITALVETGDINILRDHPLRSATIEYIGLLEADLGEFARGIALYRNHIDRLYGVMERTWASSMSPGEDETSRALLTVQDDPDAAVVIRLIHENIDNRIWYLGQNARGHGRVYFHA